MISENEFIAMKLGDDWLKRYEPEPEQAARESRLSTKSRKVTHPTRGTKSRGASSKLS
jgi:hypothetical protein